MSDLTESPRVTSCCDREDGSLLWVPAKLPLAGVCSADAETVNGTLQPHAFVLNHRHDSGSRTARL